ncbi:MAG: ATP-binding protein [Paludibacteraceae bacterium]|nr:ATP-binding protein [Paludibacteraceae bacterium]
MKEIATDIFTFEDLIKSDALYVDKTAFVAKMVMGKTKSFFLSRPRRFGKSLLLSTFKAFFQGKKDLFKGLEIERLAPDVWETYPVIHLDLASGSSYEGIRTIESAMKMQLIKSCRDLDVEIADSDVPTMFDNLIDSVYRKYKKHVVVLIDEYDKPILDSMFKPYSKEVVELMADFYQRLKSANDKERFVFITGVTKFAHVSLFSGANNPTDLTRNEDYATLLGYTEDELRHNFAEHIDYLAKKMEMSRDEFLSYTKLYYNGMRFVSRCESVYNPVSVGKLFVNKRFDNYWIATGTPRFLLNMVRNNPFELNDITQQWMLDENDYKYDLDDLKLQSVAFQTGYLSIAEWKKYSPTKWIIRYDFPNIEIRDSWYKNILSLKRNSNFSLNPLLISLSDDLNNQDVNAFMDKVCNFFSGIPYENAGEITEGYFRNHLRTLFCLFGIPNQCEIMEASQRVDIVAQTAKMALVFELKMMGKDEVDPESKKKELLESALEQAKSKGYAEKYKNESEEVHSVGIVFDEKTRKVACWKSCDF